ncbi:MAG: DUF1289 domain-containing protein [Microgenomates group bacterium]
MSEEVWRRSEVDSPCVKLCVIHPQARICIGCNRTIDEISSWSSLPTEVRREIIKELPSRTSLIAKRRGGRMGRIET